MPHPRFEVIEEEQGLGVDVDIDVTVAFAILSGCHLNACQKMLELRRPFHNGVLGERHWLTPVLGQSCDKHSSDEKGFYPFKRRPRLVVP
jgi:hypothetical protein